MQSSTGGPRRLRHLCTLAAVRLFIPISLLATVIGAGATEASTVSAQSSPTVPVAGHLQASLLAPPASHQAARPTLHPLRNPHPDALKTARQKAAGGAPLTSRAAPTNATPSAPSGSVFNGLNQPGLAAADEGNAATPPDPTGAIGPNQYIEMVNQLVGVFDRGTLARLSSTDFATFAHVPSGVGTSDPQIEWDPVANRWLYAMVGVATGNNYLLFGWTKTADPTNLSGGWCNFGVYTGSNLQDYPKLGHDANWVVIGSNVYSDTNSSFPFITAQIWAFPKPAATDTTCSSAVNATFFADATHPLKNADGTLAFTPVPANTTDSGNDYIVGTRDVSVAPASKVMVWHMEAKPAPTLVADGDISVNSYSIPPGVPQPGTGYLIDSLDGRLTQAVARFDPTAGREALWTQQTIGVSGRAAVRWYEFLPSTRTVRQQGQIASATDYYWNAAISPSSAGNDAAVFYNRGSASQLALIGAQTRASSTPLSQMDAGETVLATSNAPVTEDAFSGNCNPNPCRWGDYSGATPDLSNAHVVWGSDEIAGPAFFGFAQWQTQNFAMSTVPPAPDFSLSASPVSQNVNQGSSTTYAINIARVGGFSSAVNLSVAGLPADASGTFSPNPASGATSTLTVTTASTTPTGSSSLTINGTGGTVSHSTTATLVVSTPPPPDFSLNATPSSQSISQGSSTSFTVNVVRVGGFASAVTLSVSGLPSGVSGSFSPNPVTASSSTLSISTIASTPAGSYSLTVTGTANSLTRNASATLVVTTPPPCASAGLSPGAATQAVGTTIQFSATSTGCPNPQYEYWLQALDGSWSMQRVFSSDPTWSWNTSGLGPGTYNVHVWANQLGDSTTQAEAIGSSTITLNGCASAAIAPSSTTQNMGAAIQFSASSTGCPNPQYEYWLQLLDGTWHIQRAFSSDPTWTWNTSGLAAGTYNVHVWANNSGDSTALGEAIGASTVTLVNPNPPCASAGISPSSTTQSMGAAIQFSASSSGCPNPQYEYWLQLLDGTWHIQRAFSSDPTWTWNTSGLAAGTYTVHVWANQLGDSTALGEAIGASTVTLVNPNPPCASAGISPSSTTQPVATTIQFSASSTGCPNPQYQYWLQLLDGTWHIQRAFSSDPTWTWNTSGLAPGTYNVHVWANNSGDSTALGEAIGASTVTLVGCTSASVTPSATTAAAGTSITFTAASSGCSAPVYQFWLQDTSGNWQIMQAFSTSNTWVWNTTGWAKGTYNIHVWANQQGADTSTWEGNGATSVTVT